MQPRPALRPLAATLLVLALFALAIARLRRVPRPRFEPVVRYAGGRVAVGRVVLARRGEPGRPLGWSVVCGGREVYARAGDAPLAVALVREDRVEVRDGARDTTVVVAVGSCEAHAGRGFLAPTNR